MDLINTRMIYLYVKQHAITGLKYFGMSEKYPEKYLGSGKYWTRHCKAHGRNHVVTNKVYCFEDEDEASEFAIWFSKENNIVESDEWANLMVETAKQGNNYNRGKTYEEMYGEEKAKRLKMARSLSNQKRRLTAETGSRISMALKGKCTGESNPMYGKTHSDAIKQIISKQGREKWDDGSREKIITTLSKGTYVTPWGSFLSVSQAVKHPLSTHKDKGTLREKCKRNKGGFSFIPK